MIDCQRSVPRNCEDDSASFCENSNWKKTCCCDGRFETKWGFPQCAGAVDGTQIPIVAPSDCPTDYYNRKGIHSIIMQATADYWYCFSDIYIGWPGLVHDARVFSNSLLFEKRQAGNLFHISRGRYVG